MKRTISGADRYSGRLIAANGNVEPMTRIADASMMAALLIGYRCLGDQASQVARRDGSDPTESSNYELEALDTSGSHQLPFTFITRPDRPVSAAKEAVTSF